ERGVLLRSRASDRGDELPGDADVGEGSKRSLLLRLEVADGLEETDEALLDDVVAIRPGEEVRARLHPGEPAVPGEQDVGGAIVALAVLCQEFLVRGDVV